MEAIENVCVGGNSQDMGSFRGTCLGAHPSDIRPAQVEQVLKYSNH